MAKIDGKEDELISPSVMLIMAIVCQMKVFKYSEHVVKKGEIPKALHLVVDGEAAVTFEETIMKDGQSNPFTKAKGVFSNEPLASVAFMRRRSNIGMIKNKICINDGIPKLCKDVETEDPFPVKVVQPVNEDIEYRKIRMADYFASRILIDDAVLRNYIKE